MDSEQAKAFDVALADMERQINVLQFQVLNNLDTLVCPEGKANLNPVDPKNLDQLVKRPMMLAITKLKHDRSNLIALINRNG